MSHYLENFRLSTVVGIRHIVLNLRELNDELDSGKLNSLKEEEIKSRYIITLFSGILGFNHTGPNKWLLREETKSKIDGSKPDATLGYFYNDKNRDDVQVIIEVKDANTNLDGKQARNDKRTAVDQAFDYVAKSGGNCKWVIVTNISEIRIYTSTDRSKYQLYLLKELLEEDTLKEFLYLFHKDRFIKEKHDGNSPTFHLVLKADKLNPKDDKPIHIIDKLFNVTKKFDGLRFVDPNYIATLYPFNILPDHVWHYSNKCLFTLNQEIHDLIYHINIKDHEIEFDEDLQREITQLNIVEASYKINYIFDFLNHCLIFQITAVNNYKCIVARNKKTIGFSERHIFSFRNNSEAVKKNILILKPITCDCISCTYRTFQFGHFLKKLKSGEGNLRLVSNEFAFGHYLVGSNNFKTTYNAYKSIEIETKGKEGKSIAYFLAKLNIKYLHNLILDYPLEDAKEILEDIKSIDLDNIINNEIEYDTDRDILIYLRKIKEDELAHKIQNEIDNLLYELNKLKQLYDDGGKMFSEPDIHRELLDQYFMLYLHVNKNFLVYDVFENYKRLTRKFFQGMIWSSLLPEFGLKLFDEFVLTEAILHIDHEHLKEILRPVPQINMTDEGKEKMLQKLKNFTSSIFTIGLFDPMENTLVSEQLNNYRFKHKFGSIFSNILTVFSRLDIPKDKFTSCIKPLVTFLELERGLFWFNFTALSDFITFHGLVFTPKDLEKILKICITRKKDFSNKYNELFEAIIIAFIKFHPSYKIANKQLVNTAILKCQSVDGDKANYIPIVTLSNIVDHSCRELLYATFRTDLNESFSYDLYEKLVLQTNFDYDQENYFLQYTQEICLHKGGLALKYGKNELTDIVFMDYVLVIYKNKISHHRSELKLFSELNPFEKWILNPVDFNYNDFDAKWLLDVNLTIIMESLMENNNIGNALELELQKNFDPILAAIKYKYYANSKK